MSKRIVPRRATTSPRRHNLGERAAPKLRCQARSWRARHRRGDETTTGDHSAPVVPEARPAVQQISFRHVGWHIDHEIGQEGSASAGLRTTSPQAAIEPFRTVPLDTSSNARAPAGKFSFRNVEIGIVGTIMCHLAYIGTPAGRVWCTCDVTRRLESETFGMAVEEKRCTRPG
jgi:hypothetical protein